MAYRQAVRRTTDRSPCPLATSGGGRELLTAEELAHYEERAASLAPADLLVWLHR